MADLLKQQPKFKHEACPRCGTPQTVVNGLWLRERRKKAGLSLRDFAKRVGVSAAYICDIEHNTPKGANQPDLFADLKCRVCRM